MPTNITSRQEQLRILVELGGRMQESAEAGDWEAVDHLQQQCQQLAGEIFAEPVKDADAKAVTEAVNEVLTINKRVMKMGAMARDDTLGDLDQFQHGRRAVKEYTANTG